MELESGLFLLEHRNSDDVGRQHVTCKLNAPIFEPESGCDRFGEQGFADTRYVFYEQVPACEEARQREPYFTFLAENDLPDCGGYLICQLPGLIAPVSLGYQCQSVSP